MPRENQGPFDARLDCIEAFWHQHKTAFPNLAKLVRYFYTFLPSSAMSERVLAQAHSERLRGRLHHAALQQEVHQGLPRVERVGARCASSGHRSR